MINKIKNISMLNLLYVPLTLALLFFGVYAISSYTRTTEAASAADFKPGRIIDDAVFYNSNAMTITQIQQFLNSKVAVCDTNGQQISEFGGPDLNGDGKVQRWEWGKANYNQTVFTCLKDYSQTTPTIEAASGLCEGIPSGTRTSAQIINDVAKACHINPQVLLVLLNKEQSLVTDTWPLKQQYDSATGFDCPDTAPCDPAYAGFFYQVYHAARQFQVYKAYPNSYNYIAGRTNNIYWHPDLSRCGSSQVYIENQATAALYIYTPYRPNTAALENMYGLGDSCSSYGNRNFWRMFTDWFGTTHAKIEYSSLLQNRYLQTTKDLRKIDLRTGLEIDSVIPAGTQIYFPTKTEIGGVLYVRTEHDTNNGYDKGIKASDLAEIELVFEPMIEPRWMELTTSYQKINPKTKETIYITLRPGTKIFFSEKTSIGGKLYLRTMHDTDNDIIAGIDTGSLKEFAPPYVAMVQPRWFDDTAAPVYDYSAKPLAESPLESPIAQPYYYKTDLNGSVYLRKSMPAGKGEYLGVRLNDVSAIKPSFLPMIASRYLKTTKDLRKIDLRTGLEIDFIIPAGTKIYFTTKVDIGDEPYLRTKHDTDRNFEKGIKISDLTEI